MTTKDKLLEKIKNNPKNASFRDIRHILLDRGYTERQPSSGSSHYIYTNGKKRLTVPFKRPHIKEYAVKQVLEAIEEEYEQKY